MNDDWKKGYCMDGTIKALMDLQAAAEEEAPNLVDDRSSRRKPRGFSPGG